MLHRRVWTGQWVGDSSWNGYEQDKLFHNDGRGRFVEVGYVAGGVDEATRDGRSAALLDYNHNGAVDVLVSTRRGPPFLLENRAGARRHWLQVRLVGTRSNRQAVGARVTLRDGAYVLLQEKRAGQGFAGSYDTPLFFGLGRRRRVPTLEVRWPLGLRQTFTDLPADRLVTLTEGDARATLSSLAPAHVEDPRPDAEKREAGGR